MGFTEFICQPGAGTCTSLAPIGKYGAWLKKMIKRIETVLRSKSSSRRSASRNESRQSGI
jgi:hypothetical protein